MHSTDTPITQEQSSALAAARELALAGVPIFRAVPDPTSSTGYSLPLDWQHSGTYEHSLAAIEAWRPGDALAAVCGHTLDVIDVDPRNGGEDTANGLNAAGMVPYIYASAATPSGGFHHFVAALGVPKGTAGPGVDIQAGDLDGFGRGFVFIAPTVRVSKVDGQPRAYRWIKAPDAEFIREETFGDDTGAALAELIRRDRPRPERAPARRSGRIVTKVPTFTLADAEAHVTPLIRRFAEQGYDGRNYNSQLNDLAVRVGHFVPAFTTREAAETLLYAAAEQCGMLACPPGYNYRPDGPRTVRGTIASGLDRGMAEPYRLREDGPGKDDDDAEPGNRPSWAPVDVVSVLDGSYVPPVPEMMPRDDGPCLLYRGLVHSFHGESESGKSLLAQAETTRVLREGGHVTYIDLESDMGSVVGRLLAMGAPAAAIKDGLAYVRPDAPPTAEHEREAFAALLDLAADLVVIDGVTEALGLWGTESKDNDGVTNWMRQFPRRLAASTGAAVVLVDHVTKATDGRGRFAIGAQAKLAAIDGAAYVVEVRAPLGRGLRGAVGVRVAKDRPGGVRPHCAGWRSADRTQEAAYVIIDSTGDDRRIRFEWRTPRIEADSQSQLMAAISVFLSTQTVPVSQNAIVNGVHGNERDIRFAVNALGASGHVRIDRGPRNTMLHSLIRPYEVETDEKLTSA